MAKAHFGSKISPNMKRTPEDFLICYNVPIARTGVQKYLGKETSKVLQQNSYQSRNNRTIQRICQRGKVLAINQKI